jgi:hypothetical protein
MFQSWHKTQENHIHIKFDAYFILLFQVGLVSILYKVTNLSPYATLLSSNNIAITFIVVPINWVGINIQHRNKCSPTPPINMKINMKIEQFFIVMSFKCQHLGQSMSGQLKIVACSYYPYGWTQCLVPHSIFTLLYCYPYSNLTIHMFLEMFLEHPHSYWVFKHALVFFTSIYLHILSPTHKLEIVILKLRDH